MTAVAQFYSSRNQDRWLYLDFDSLHFIEDVLHLVDLESSAALDRLERGVVVLFLFSLKPLEPGKSS